MLRDDAGGATDRPRDRNPERRRRRIVEAALDVFAAEGYRAAEVQTIAERARVGKATIYKHFEGKEALFLAIVQENLDRLAERILGTLVGAGRPIERLEAAVRGTLTHMEQNRGILRVLIQEAGEFAGEIQRRYLLVVEANLPLAESFFATLNEDGGFRQLPTRQVVQLLVNLLIGTVYSWSLSGEGSMVDEGMGYLRVLLAGLARDPESLPASLRLG